MNVPHPRQDRSYSALSINVQKGVVLVIALISLLAMTLAGVALVRSVDTTNLVAGNLAFRQSTLMSTDAGIQSAYRWLIATSKTSLEDDMTRDGYFSSIPAQEPDWQSEATWQNAVTVGADASGNRVQYMIHRACSVANAAPARSSEPLAPNQCSTSDPYKKQGTNTARFNGGDTNEPARYGESEFLYRITARVIGPRNTVSITQASVIY